MRASTPSRRPGFTLVEVLIALVLTAIVGAAVTSVFMSQNAYYDAQEKISSARAVSRAAINMLLTELRAVETTDGLIAAGPDSLRVKVPFALGVSCGSLHVSLLPVDSAVLAQALPRYAGYQWRDPATGTYSSVAGGTIATVTGSNPCTTATYPIRTTFSDMSHRGRVMLLPTGTVPTATVVLLYQVITYRFDDSALVPGERGLWREVEGIAGTAEELAAPFDETAHFRFYELDNTSAQDAPPTDIDDLRGVELVMTGRSDRPGAGGSERTTPLTTAIFFRNRID